MSDREDEGGGDQEGWYPRPGEWFPPPIVSPLPPEPQPAPDQKVGAALLAGSIAAVVGGIAWGLVVKWTGYEAGILALGDRPPGRLRGLSRDRRPPRRRAQVDRGRDGSGRHPDRQVPQLRLPRPGRLPGCRAVVGRDVQALPRRSPRHLRALRPDLDRARRRGSLDRAPGRRRRARRPAPTAGEPVPLPAPAEPQRRSRNPVDRLTQGLPHGMRITIDWIVTIAGAIAIVLAIKAWVVNPYRIPSSSMEPTLHCAQARPRVRGALLRPRAREPVHLPVPRSRAGRHRRLRDAARRAGALRRRRDVREAPDRPAGRAARAAHRGRAQLRLHQRQEARRAVHRPQPARHARPRDLHHPRRGSTS